MADLTINNLEELKAFRDRVNSGENFSGKTVVLAADIDLNNEEWTPIGNSTNKFQGTFDGQGHTVSNLNVNGGSSWYQGFFGFAADGAIKNVNFHNAAVTGCGAVGVVAGCPFTSDLSNITLTGKITVDAQYYVGGVAGYNCYGDFTDITIDADEGSYVKADSGNNRTYVGGVAGFLGEDSAHLSNITSNINVEGSTIDVGGIVGIAHYNNVFENVSCTADSIVMNSDYGEVGAIAGTWNNKTGTSVTMINCSVGENTSVKQVVTDENGTETTTELTGVLNGAAYTMSNLENGGSLKVVEEIKTADGVQLKFSVTGGNASVEDFAKEIVGEGNFTVGANGEVISNETFVCRIGTTWYTSINEAVKAAVDGDTIIIKGGTYDENIILTPEAVGTAAKDLTFKAATGEQVDFKGLFQCGLYVNQTINVSSWNGEIVLEGINFINDGVDTNLDFQSSGNVTVKDCTFSAGANYSDDDSLINFVSGCNTMLVTFDGCDFSGGRVNSGGQSVVYNSCTFTDCKTNIQHGVETTYNDCDFMVTITDAANNDNFYVIRTNDIAVNINGGSVTVDANVSDGIAPGSKVWAVFWQRNAGATKWDVADLTVKYTDKANDLGVLVFNNNATSTPANAMDRATFAGTEFYVGDTKVDNAELFLSSIGYVSSGDALYYNGDVFALDKIMVDPSYTANGSVFEVNGEKYLIGVNAFATLKDAADKAVDGTTIVVAGDLAAGNGVGFINGGTVTLTGDATFDWSGKQFYIGRSDTANAKDSTLVIKDAVIGSSSDQASTGIHVSGAAKDSSKKADGTLIIENSEIEVDYFSAKNQTTLSGSTLHIKNGFGLMGRSGTESADGTDKTAVMNVNNSTLHIEKDANYGVGGYSADDAYGVLNITGSTLKVDEDLHIRAGKGMLNVNNGTVDAVKITNDGDFNVSGESQLNIGTLTGTVDVLDGATIKDSEINGVVNVGEEESTATVTFKGDNRIGKIVVGNGDKIIVSSDASLDLFTQRSTFGSGATWDIDGNIVDAEAVTAEEKAALKASLSANGLSFSDYSGSTSTMTVDNAYVKFTNAVTSKQDNANGGKFTIGINNSIVDATKFAIQANSNANTPQFDIDFTDSVVNASSHFLNADENSAMTFDNSKLAVNGSFRNDGTFELLNGSEMTVNGYIQENENAGMYGKFIVNNSSVNVVTSSTGHAMINRGTIELRNDASMTIGYLTNAGTITVDAQSSVKVASISNNGFINLVGSTLTAGNINLGKEGIKVNNVDDPNSASKITTDANTVVAVNNAVVNVSGNFTNHGAATVSNSVLDVDGTFFNDYNGVTISGSTVRINKLDNDHQLFIEGENTIQIEDATGSSYAIRCRDGVVFNDSYIKATDNFTTRLLGSATFNGGFAAAYLQGSSGGVGGTVTIDGLVDVSYGVEFSNNYVLNGGTIRLAGGNAAGTIWGCAFQDSTFTINTDIEVIGGGATAPIHFTDATATVNSSITQRSSGGKPIYITDSSVTLGKNGKIDSDCGIFLTASEFIVNGGTVKTSTLNNSGAVTLTADSLLIAGNITNSGTITIDATGFTSGVKTVIDLSGTTQLSGVTFTNVADGVQTVLGADGDVTLVRKEIGSLYVKDSYIDADAVKAEVGDGLVYGVDAFNSVKSAFEKAIALGGGTICVLGTPQEVESGSNFNSLIKMTGASGMDFVLTGKNAGNEFVAIEMRNNGADEDFVLVDGKKATLLVTDADMSVYKLAAYQNSVITIENSTLDFRDAINGLIYTKGNGEMYVRNSVLKDMNQLSAYGSMMSVENSVLDSGSAVRVFGEMSVSGSTFNFSGVRIGDDGVLTLEDSKMVSNSVLTKNESQNTQNVKNGKVELYVGYGNASNNDVVTGGTLSLKDSEFSITGGTLYEGSATSPGTVNVSSAGVVSIENSKFSADVVNNNGAFYVSGASKLNIGTLTGVADPDSGIKGVIHFEDGAVITDSTIGGGIELMGGVHNWHGTNKVHGMFSAGYDNHGGDLTLNITGDFETQNLLAWGDDGETVINIGSADGARTKLFGDQIGIFENTTVNVNNADVTYGYTFIRSAFNVKNSTMEIVGSGINTYFSGNAVVTVDNSVWKSGAYTCLGSYNNSVASGNADVTVKGGSELNAGNLTLTTTTGTGYVVKLTVDNATVNATTALKVGAGASMLVTGGMVKAAVLNNSGYLTLMSDKDNTVGNFINEKSDTGNAMIFDAKLTVSGDFTNHGQLDISNSTLIVGGKFFNDYDGVTISGSTVRINKLENDNQLFIDGKNTIQVEDATGSGFAIRVNHNAVLSNSYIKASDNATLRLLGSATFKGGFTGAYFQTNCSWGGTVTIDGTMMFTNSVEINYAYTLNGGKIITKADAYIQSGSITLNSDLDCERHMRFSSSTVTIKSKVATVESSQEHMMALRNATVTVDGGVLSSCDYISLGFYNYVTGSEYGKTDYASTLKAVNGGTISMVSNLHLNAGSEVSLDHTSKLVIGGSVITYGDVVFNIDTTGYTSGSYKVIDYTGTGSMDYSFVNGFGTNDKLKVIDNDLYVYGGDQKTIYFDDTFTADSALADGKIYGYNAVNDWTSFSGSLVVNNESWGNLLLLPEETEKLVLAGGNEKSYGMFRTIQDITIETTGSDYAVIDRFVNCMGDLTFAANSKVKVLGVDGSTGVNNHEHGSVNVYGDVLFANGSNKAPLMLWGTRKPGNFIVHKGGTFTAEAGNVQNYGGHIIVKGTMTLGSAGDAPKICGADQTFDGGHLTVDGCDGEGVLTVLHNRLNMGGGDISGNVWVDAGAGCTADIKNGGKIVTSAVSFRNGVSNTLTMDGGTFTFVNNPGYASITPSYFDNKGVINVLNNSALDMTDRKFINEGTIEISNSKFVVDTFTNNGSFVSNGADITVGTVTLDNPSELTELYNTDFEVTGNSISVKAGSCFWVYEYSSLNGENATMTVNNGAVVAVDASSTITLDAVEFVGDGRLNIEICDIYTSEGWKTIYNGGVVKVVDLDMANGIDQSKVSLIQDQNQNASLFFGEDGDIYVTDAVISRDNVYVNSTYTGSGSVTSDGYIVGINAFDAIDSAMASGAAKMTITGGEFGKLGFNGVDTTITDGTINGVVYGGNADGDANVSDNSTLTIAGGKMAQTVYGGNRVHGGTSIANNGIVTVAGDIAVNVSGGSFTELIGGDIVTQAVIFVREGDINMNISGGVFSSRVHGGITVHSVANKEHMVQTIGDINMNISGGTFNARVYGGNWAQKYNLSDKLSHTGNISVTVNAVNEVVFGEHLVIGSSGVSMVHGDVKLTLSGNGSNLKFASNSVLLGASGDSYYVVDGSNRTPVSYVDGNREIVFDGFSGNVDAEIKMFNALSLTGDSAVNFSDSAINLKEITSWNFEAGSVIESAANGIDLSGDTINLSGTWADGAAFELGNSAAFTAWNDVTVNYNGVAVDCELKSEDNKLIITKLA